MPRDLLAPMPARGKQPVRLHFHGSRGPNRWRVFNLAGERVAELGFQAHETAQWEHQGAAAGVYLIRVDIDAPDGARVVMQKAALLP